MLFKIKCHLNLSTVWFLVLESANYCVNYVIKANASFLSLSNVYFFLCTLNFNFTQSTSSDLTNSKYLTFQQPQVGEIVFLTQLRKMRMKWISAIVKLFIVVQVHFLSVKLKSVNFSLHRNL